MGLVSAVVAILAFVNKVRLFQLVNGVVYLLNKKVYLDSCQISATEIVLAEKVVVDNVRQKALS